MRHIGIYPGTFDPIHQGHIAFATEAIQQCSLDEVIFCPERTPRGKSNVSPIDTRIAFIQQAIGQTPQFRIAELSSDQFTITSTLAELRKITANAEMTLLIGSDVALGLDNWHEIKEIVATFSFAIGIRSDAEVDAIEQLLNDIAEMYSVHVHYTFVTTDAADLRSSEIRQKFI